MKASKLWPAALVGVLAITVVANGALYWTASHDRSFAVEPDYYQQAVHWDSSVARSRRSAALGWATEVRLAPPDGGAATLTVTITTRDGLPLDSADVRATLSHNAEGARTFNLTLRPSGPAGRYAARLPSSAQGLWRVDLSATRGQDAYARRVTADNGGPGQP